MGPFFQRFFNVICQIIKKGGTRTLVNQYPWNWSVACVGHTLRRAPREDWDDRLCKFLIGIEICRDIGSMTIDLVKLDWTPSQSPYVLDPLSWKEQSHQIVSAALGDWLYYEMLKYELFPTKILYGNRAGHVRGPISSLHWARPCQKYQIPRDLPHSVIYHL